MTRYLVRYDDGTWWRCHEDGRIASPRLLATGQCEAMLAAGLLVQHCVLSPTATVYRAG